MILVCTGGRDYDDKESVAIALTALAPRKIYVGDCPTGADKFVREWANKAGAEIEVFCADWRQYGKFAGPRRNSLMVKMAASFEDEDAICLAFPGGKGTAHCMSAARVESILVLEVKP